MDREYEGKENLEVMLEAVNYNQYLKDLVRRYQGDATSVLDFGAGIGTFADSTGLEPSMVHCVEPDVDARQILIDKGYTVYTDLSEVTESFDYIYTLNVLEHIEDDHAKAQELYERLKPGGTLFVYVPAFDSLRTSLDDLVGHYRRYTADTLRHVCLQAGFVVDDLQYTDFGGVFATLLFKVMDRFKKNPDGMINKSALIAYDRIAFPVSLLLSRVFKRLLGKNVFVVARRPA